MYSLRTVNGICRSVLEVIVNHPGILSFELCEMAGYPAPGCRVAAHHLRQLKLIEMDGWLGRNRATERGKIAMALIRGKEMRSRTRRLIKR